MGRIVLLLLPLVFVSLQGMSQSRITWRTLEDVEFSEKYHEKEDAYYLYPAFGKEVKELQGKEVYLKGYMLPIDPTSGYYLLSRSPMASCFFCGAAGPETVVELKMKPGHDSFDMDQIVTMQGRLKLNSDDVYQCNYIFEAAEVYED